MTSRPITSLSRIGVLVALLAGSCSSNGDASDQSSCTLDDQPSATEAPPAEGDDFPFTETVTDPGPEPGATTTLSGHVRAATLTVPAGATLALDPDEDTFVELTGNLLVEGTLEMQPADAGVTHTLRFVDIDENDVVGGGMDPIASDVGLWVMGSGRLDAAGAPKTAWTNLAGSAPVGASTLELASAPSGWQVGDEISVAPTDAGDHEGFDEATITSISGATITLDRCLEHPHPEVGDRWTAEVMNLSRNVRIEGTGDGSLDPASNGRTHILVRSTRPQHISYVAARHVGPRPAGISTERPIVQEQAFPSPMDMTGRYGIHFHHSGDGSRGTVVEGVVVRDAGNHAFVPHMSHGITFTDTISYNTTHDAYWWDGARCPPPCNLDNFRKYKQDADSTDDVLFDRAIAARVRSGSDVARLSGFELGHGDGNVVRNSIAVGVQETAESNGFEWPEGGHRGVWTFTDNLAHNNAKNGAFVWQNTTKPHMLENFDAYHNEVGIRHGAYTNDYEIRGGTLYGNARTGILLDAVSKSEKTIRFEDIVIDGGGTGNSAIETSNHRASRSNPTVFAQLTMRGFTGPGAVLFNTGGDHTDRIDFIDPTFSGNEFYVERMVEGSQVVVRTDGTTYELTPTSQRGAEWMPAWNAYRTDS